MRKADLVEGVWYAVIPARKYWAPLSEDEACRMRYLGPSDVQIEVWMTESGKGQGHLPIKKVRVPLGHIRVPWSEWSAFVEEKNGGVALTRVVQERERLRSNKEAARLEALPSEEDVTVPQTKYVEAVEQEEVGLDLREELERMREEQAKLAATLEELKASVTPPSSELDAKETHKRAPSKRAVDHMRDMVEALHSFGRALSYPAVEPDEDIHVGDTGMDAESNFQEIESLLRKLGYRNQIFELSGDYACGTSFVLMRRLLREIKALRKLATAV